jgi:hypothetical protein
LAPEGPNVFLGKESMEVVSKEIKEQVEVMEKEEWL